MFADVRDLPRLKSVIAETQPQMILHLAAQSVVRRGYEDPVETYSSNVMGTVNVLEAVRQPWTPLCAWSTSPATSATKIANGSGAIAKTSPWEDVTPTRIPKACAELVSSAYRDSYFPADQFHEHGVALGSARAGNAIGGGDWTSDQLIPDLIRGFLTGKPCLIRNPTAIRPWQFVLEPLRGYLMLAERLSEDAESIRNRLEFWSCGSRRQACVLDCGQTRHALGRFSLLESGWQVLTRMKHISLSSTLRRPIVS